MSSSSVVFVLPVMALSRPIVNRSTRLKTANTTMATSTAVAHCRASAPMKVRESREEASMDEVLEVT